MAEQAPTKKIVGAPWFALRCSGDPVSRAIPYLQELGLETYYPVVREIRPLPQRLLSRAQRTSGVVIMRPRSVPFLVGVVFARGKLAGHVESFTRRSGHQFKIGGHVPAENLQRRDVRWEDVFTFPGLLGFLTDPDRGVPHFEIDGLRARAIDGVIAGRTPARMIFAVGEEVRISHGPFTSFNAIVEQTPDAAIEDIDADTRLKLTINIFGRFTPVDMAAWQIEKL